MDADVYLAHIAQGDADAFAAWLSSTEHEVRVSLRAFAATVDTEAVLQEALLRVWQAAPRVVPDGRPNALLRFAVRTARNTAIGDDQSAPDAQAGEFAGQQLQRAEIELDAGQVVDEGHGGAVSPGGGAGRD